MTSVSIDISCRIGPEALHSIFPLWVLAPNRSHSAVRRPMPAEPGDLIFTDAEGGPIRRSRWSEIWRAAADPVGLPKGTGFHALRHHYASTLIRAGESVKVVQERLGHTSATMTFDVYGHLFPDDEDRTRDAVDAVIGPALATVRSA